MLLGQQGRRFGRMLGLLFDLRQAEVQDLGLSPIRHKDVRGLDVAVDDAPGVSRIEGISQLAPQLEDLSDLEGLPRDAVFQRLPLEELPDDERLHLLLARGLVGPAAA